MVWYMLPSRKRRLMACSRNPERFAGVAEAVLVGVVEDLVLELAEPPENRHVAQMPQCAPPGGTVTPWNAKMLSRYLSQKTSW